jgi:hypothetical protein
MLSCSEIALLLRIEKDIRKGDGAGPGLPRHRKVPGMDYGLGTGFSLVPWTGSSFIFGAPEQICIIWDIISTQLKEEPDFLAPIIFRILSAKGIPSQQLLNSFRAFF